MNRDNRIAQNQQVFKDANERLEEPAERYGDGGPVPFLCECGDSRCTELVRLTLDDYRSIRTHPRRFFLLREHEANLAHAEHVVAERDHYLVVEKEEGVGRPEEEPATAS